MKKTNLVLTLGTLLLGLGLQTAAQETLPEVTITAVRYKYLSAVNDKDVAQPVKMLERKAAESDVRKADFYEDDYDTYFVSFYIPDGKILAAYDKDGKLLRTAEKFKNLALPTAVRNAIIGRFPKWTIANDAYLVTYQEEYGARKEYKVTLQNG